MGDIISLEDYLAALGEPLRPPAKPPSPTFAYVWFWNTKLPERRGQHLRLVCSGRLNSCLVQFVDGWTVITSRNALRKNVRLRQPA